MMNNVQNDNAHLFLPGELLLTASSPNNHIDQNTLRDKLHEALPKQEQLPELFSNFWGIEHGIDSTFISHIGEYIPKYGDLLNNEGIIVEKFKEWHTIVLTTVLEGGESQSFFPGETSSSINITVQHPPKEGDDIILPLYALFLNWYLPSESEFEFSATPSWLLFGAPHNTATGGPGSLPIPPGERDEEFQRKPGRYKDSWYPGEAHYCFDEHNMPEQIARLPTGGGQRIRDAIRARGRQAASGRGAENGKAQEEVDVVEVYILDTIPPAAKLTKFSDAGHSLLETLHPEKLSITNYIPAPPESDPQFEERQKYGEAIPAEYNASHGIFIAGIIHTIAPKANPHLIQVLNRNGVGTYSSLKAGLENVKNQIDEKGGKHVINVSLTLPIVSPKHLKPEEINEYLTDDDVPAIIKLILILSEIWGEWVVDLFLRSYEAMFLPLIELASSNQAIIIAAAGNDGFTAVRHPAAIGKIIGVGSVRRDWERSSFSNSPDEGEPGFWAYGGEVNYRETLPGDGLLSIYVADKYPTGGTNTTGWAEWSGTSFATAVVSGSLALLLSNQQVTINDAITALQGAVLEEVRNEEDEEVGNNRHHYIPLLQGYPAPAPNGAERSSGR